VAPEAVMRQHQPLKARLRKCSKQGLAQRSRLLRSHRLRLQEEKTGIRESVEDAPTLYPVENARHDYTVGEG